MGCRLSRPFCAAIPCVFHGTAPFLYRLRIVKVTRALRQQEQILMALGRPVRHALRHRVRFRPDDVAPQPPAVSLQRERHPPRDAAQVFRL